MPPRLPGPGRGHGTHPDLLPHDYYHAWLSIQHQWKLSGLAPLSVRTYLNIAVRFFSWCHHHHIPLSSLSETHALQYLAKFQPPTPYTDLVTITLNRILNSLHTIGIIARPQPIRLRKRAPALPPALPPSEAIAAFLSEAESASLSHDPLRQMHGTIALVIAYTGLRARELGTIRCADLAFDPSSNQPVSCIVTRKRAFRHEIFFAPKLQTCLDHWLTRLKQGWRQPSPYLFPSTKNGGPLPYTEVYRAFRILSHLSKTQLNPHVLRTVLANFLANQQASTRDIMDIMGHTDPRSALRYLPRSADRLKHLVKAFSQSLSSHPPLD